MVDEPVEPRIVAAVGTAASHTPLGQLIQDWQTAALEIAFAKGMSVYDTEAILALKDEARARAEAAFYAQEGYHAEG